MANGWTLGTPPTQRGLSALVEVTDGNRTQCARFRDDRAATREADAAWLADDGTPLGWQPTHWRRAASRPPQKVFELD